MSTKIEFGNIEQIEMLKRESEEISRKEELKDMVMLLKSLGKREFGFVEALEVCSHCHEEMDSTTISVCSDCKQPIRRNEDVRVWGSYYCRCCNCGLIIKY